MLIDYHLSLPCYILLLVDEDARVRKFTCLKLVVAALTMSVHKQSFRKSELVFWK